MFALWSPGDDRADATTTAVSLAVPDETGRTLAVDTVHCDLVEPSTLSEHTSTSASMSAWIEATTTGTPPAALPPVAHAVPDPTGTAITSTDHARRVFTETVAVERTLRDDVRASLRPYQARGVGWLARTVDTEGGAILADEMGLGKTVQAIGLMVLRDDAPTLVVCPKSLISNWLREIGKFAPRLRAGAWPASDGGAPCRAPASVTVIAYSTLRARTHDLSSTPWGTIVFDEAQAVKNHRTQVSRAARALDAPARVALTGTPVENHLDELWSILNLVAPKRFTHRALYRRRFTVPASTGDAGALVRLRAATAPVMLRRSKSEVASSLPPKIDNPVLCDLTDEQTAIYDRLLAEAIEAGFGSGLARHGRVLATLTALKQLCNHPGLCTGDLGELAGRSGKLDACTDVVAANIESEAATVVFTQYRATGDLLVRHFGEQFGLDIPFFHGGMSIDERDEMVERFQRGHTAPVMVMSLKAGGVGLTLTRASDVVHFDRWWNPAVEAQASDRVHRIGQSRTVTITTLTTATTVEEHIASMHDRKSALSAQASDSSVVTELASLPDERLLEVLARSRGNR